MVRKHRHLVFDTLIYWRGRMSSSRLSQLLKKLKEKEKTKQKSHILEESRGFLSLQWINLHSLVFLQGVQAGQSPMNDEFKLPVAALDFPCFT